jgi:hypothetical protein
MNPSSTPTATPRSAPGLQSVWHLPASKRRAALALDEGVQIEAYETLTMDDCPEVAGTRRGAGA